MHPQDIFSSLYENTICHIFCCFSPGLDGETLNELLLIGCSTTLAFTFKLAGVIFLNSHVDYYLSNHKVIYALPAPNVL